MGIFSKFFKKSQKSEPSENSEINSQSLLPSNKRKTEYFINSVWHIEKSCIPEYDMGTDLILGGCGATTWVSEYDIMNENCEIYGWQCKICKKWHGIPDFEIPEEVKERIKYRNRLKRGDNPVVIDFREYKQKKSKIGNTKKSND